jgi:hypothetical protein
LGPLCVAERAVFLCGQFSKNRYSGARYRRGFYCAGFSLPKRSAGFTADTQGIGVYFHVPGNCHVLEEVLTAKANKSNKFLRSPLFLTLRRVWQKKPHLR